MMKPEDLNKIITFLVSCVLGLGVAIYSELKTNQRDITVILQKHEERLTHVERDVAVLQVQQDFLGSEKKNSTLSNFKQYLCVNNYPEKRKKKSDEVLA